MSKQQNFTGEYSEFLSHYKNQDFKSAARIYFEQISKVNELSKKDTHITLNHILFVLKDYYDVDPALKYDGFVQFLVIFQHLDQFGPMQPVEAIMN